MHMVYLSAHTIVQWSMATASKACGEICGIAVEWDCTDFSQFVKISSWLLFALLLQVDSQCHSCDSLNLLLYYVRWSWGLVFYQILPLFADVTTLATWASHEKFHGLKLHQQEVCICWDLSASCSLVPFRNKGWLFYDTEEFFNYLWALWMHLSDFYTDWLVVLFWLILQFCSSNSDSPSMCFSCPRKYIHFHGTIKATIFQLLLLMISSKCALCFVSLLWEEYSLLAVIWCDLVSMRERICVSAREALNWDNSTQHKGSACTPALKTADTESISQAPWSCGESSVPSTTTFPFCSHKDACACLQPGKAAACQKAHDKPQWNIFYGCSPWWYVQEFLLFTSFCVYQEGITVKSIKENMFCQFSDWTFSWTAGDNLILGSQESKLAWFDMDLSTKPYKIVK